VYEILLSCHAYHSSKVDHMFHTVSAHGFYTRHKNKDHRPSNVYEYVTFGFAFLTWKQSSETTNTEEKRHSA